MKNFSLQNIFSNIFKAALFIFCAIPGAFILLFSLILLAMPIIEKSNPDVNYFYYFYYFWGIIGGSFLLIIGLGKTKQPLYLAVILIFPVIIFVPALIIDILPETLSRFAQVVFASAFLPLLFIAPFFVKKRIDKFYEKSLI